MIRRPPSAVLFALLALPALAPAAPAGDTPPPDEAGAPAEAPPFHHGLELPPDLRADADLLKFVEDDQPIAGLDFNDREVAAYNYLVNHAKSQPDELLRKYAARDITFAHLMSTHGHEYRGALVHGKGRLKRLLKMNAPKMLREDGIETLYEGWVFPDPNHPYPFCVLFTEKPDNLPLGAEIDEWVAFEAYSFKRYKYKAQDDHWRLCPLLIGKSMRLASAPEDSIRKAFQWTFVPLAVGTIGTLVVAAVCFTWYFRQGDRALRSRLGDLGGRNPFDQPDTELGGV
jgi:hypothetical protein